MDRYKSILSILFFILGLIVLAYFILLMTLPGNMNFGLVFTAIVGLSLLLFSVGLRYKKKHLPWNGIWKILKIGIILFALWFLSFLAIVFMLYENSQRYDISEPEYLIILGASLDGDRPGLTLEQRLLTGLEYLKQHPEIPVIVSGGQGQGETITEAEAMSIFLRENGIPEERIILESASTSTAENFRFSASLLKNRGESQPVKIMIVTNEFHLLRAAMLAERSGFISGRIPARTPLHVLPVNLLREYFALPKSLLLDT